MKESYPKSNVKESGNSDELMDENEPRSDGQVGHSSLLRARSPPCQDLRKPGIEIDGYGSHGNLVSTSFFVKVCTGSLWFLIFIVS